MEIKHALIVTLCVIAFIALLDALWDRFESKKQAQTKSQPETTRVEHPFKKAHYECKNGYLYIVIGDKVERMSSTIRNTCNEELMNAHKGKTTRKSNR